MHVKITRTKLVCNFDYQRHARDTDIICQKDDIKTHQHKAKKTCQCVHGGGGGGWDKQTKTCTNICMHACTIVCMYIVMNGCIHVGMYLWCIYYWVCWFAISGIVKTRICTLFSSLSPHTHTHTHTHTQNQHDSFLGWTRTTQDASSCLCWS